MSHYECNRCTWRSIFIVHSLKSYFLYILEVDIYPVKLTLACNLDDFWCTVWTTKIHSWIFLFFFPHTHYCGRAAVWVRFSVGAPGQRSRGFKSTFLISSPLLNDICQRCWPRGHWAGDPAPIIQLPLETDRNMIIVAYPMHLRTR